MTYTKPEINLLGDADQLIHAVGKMSGQSDGVWPYFADPSYDLDE